MLRSLYARSARVISLILQIYLVLLATESVGERNQLALWTTGLLFLAFWAQVIKTDHSTVADGEWDSSRFYLAVLALASPLVSVVVAIVGDEYLGRLWAAVLIVLIGIMYGWRARQYILNCSQPQSLHLHR